MRPNRTVYAKRMQAMFEAGRRQLPLSYDVELGRARHRAWVGSDMPTPDWANVMQATAQRSLAALIVKSLVAAVGLAVVFAYLRGSPSTGVQHHDAPARVSQASPAPLESLVSQSPARVEVAANVAEKAEPPAHELAPRQASSMRQKQRSRRPPAPLPMAAPRAVESAYVPAAIGGADPSGPSETAGPSHDDTAPARATVHTVAPLPSTRPPAEVPADLRELRDFATAERALARDPKLALELAVRGEQRFPNGYLQQERAYVAVMALIALGRVEQARSDAAHFFSRYPNTPYATHIRRALQAAHMTKEP